MHGTAMWWSSMVGHWCSMVWLGPSRVYAWWRGSRVGSRTRSLALSLSLSLSLGGGGSCCGGLLLHLLPRLHLGVSELLHVERLALGEQLLTLKLQLHRETEETPRKMIKYRDYYNNQWQEQQLPCHEWRVMALVLYNSGSQDP